MNTDYALMRREVKAAVAKVTGRWMLRWLPATAHMHLGDEKIQVLSAALNAIAGRYRPGIKIYAIEVEDCKTVQDCINLVINAISGNEY